MGDANISSQTSKLNTKIELLEKENMGLKRIHIIEEVIIQKLSSNKNITKEITKTDKTDCSTNTGGNTLSKKDVRIQNVRIH